MGCRPYHYIVVIRLCLTWPGWVLTESSLTYLGATPSQTSSWFKKERKKVPQCALCSVLVGRTMGVSLGDWVKQIQFNSLRRVLAKGQAMLMDN